MQVFISWSGKRSRAVAALLDEWIQCVIQAINPWLSNRDIDRGSLWFTELTDQLAEINTGIICLTKDNLNEPWILFESGALAKGLTSSRVCTFLIDLKTEDVSGPLAQFNHTLPDKDGLRKLVRTLNSSLGETALKEKALDLAFETYWPQFEQKFKEALEQNPAGAHEPRRSAESMLSEVLLSVRSLDRKVQRIGRERLFRNTESIGSFRVTEDGRVVLHRSPRSVKEDIAHLVKENISPQIISNMYSRKLRPSTIERMIRDAREEQRDESEDDLPEDDPDMPIP